MKRTAKRGVILVTIGLLGWVLFPRSAPLASAPAPAFKRALPPDLGAPVPPPLAESERLDNPEPLSDRDLEAAAQLQLGQLDRIRKIPGAAPLLDEVIAALKEDDQETNSLDHIETDEHGLAEISDEAIEQMISDPALRAKWDQLMTMVAEHPEVMGEEERSGDGE